MVQLHRSRQKPGNILLVPAVRYFHITQTDLLKKNPQFVKNAFGSYVNTPNLHFTIPGAMSVLKQCLKCNVFFNPTA